MKHLIIVLISLFVLSGCTTFRDYKEAGVDQAVESSRIVGMMHYGS